MAVKKKAEKIEISRENILSAAAALFAENGAAGVTMRALARKLGASTMASYHYFKDKDEILAEVLRQAFDRFVTVLDKAGEIGGNAFERARAKRFAYSKLALAEPGIYRVMFEMPHPCEADYPGMAAAMQRARATMCKTMEELIAAGMIAGRPETLGHVFWSAIHGPLSLHLAGKMAPELDVEEVIDTAILGLFFSLAPRPE